MREKFRQKCKKRVSIVQLRQFIDFRDGGFENNCSWFGRLLLGANSGLNDTNFAHANFEE